MAKVLLALDTDQIKRYVFATGKLKEIRGASSILDELNRTEMANQITGTKIYAHGGSGLFVVNSLAEAEKATQRVKRLYAENTAGAVSISAVTVELQQNFDKNKTDIRPYWKLLARKLDLIKMQKTTPHTILTFPYFRHCDSCGEYNAKQIDEDEIVCPVCMKKREKNYEIRNEAIRQKKPLPQTFEDIGEFSRPEGYFALLYADGDGFGTEIEKNCRTLCEIGKFATAVDRALRKSADTATKKLRLSSNSFDTLLQGGDDLVIALPAQYALEAASEIVTGFRKRIRKYLKKELTISAAVVWAHDKFPFANFLHLTESTLRFAKTDGVKRGQRGLINFLVVSNANHLDFEKFYKRELITKGPVKIVRTLRPYTPDALNELLKARRNDKVAKAPRSKIQQLRQAVFRQSFQQANLDAIMALSHWRDEERRKFFMQLPTQLLPDAQNRVFPWVIRDEEYRTPFADLAEIFDFTEGESDAAENESH